MDEFFVDFDCTISAYDDFECAERKEKIGMMVDLIAAQCDEDDKILSFLCKLIDDEKYIDYLCEQYHITKKDNNFYVDEEYLKDSVFADR